MTRAASPPVIRPCGDAAWLLDVGDNDLVHRWADAVRAADLPGVCDVVPGLETLLVQLDPDIADAGTVRAAIADIEPAAGGSAAHERHVIDVRYDGEDLADIARFTGLTVDQVVAAHTSTEWRVAFCGFAPGFSYLIGGDPRLRVPRRDEARIRVPAGSVALAGEFSSIYPRVSPGGWQLLGHTDAVLWDSAVDPPAVLRPGAVVQFRAVDR
ncbi:allophanate hydrolase [Mycolicibacterium agri]|uniref:Allophanate hydrolase n=1 Tax=Mycolicibacterium agri TaxID=36811 RepID=A0A2A7N4A6_MYCAG|nr:allophanate hydrolase subunit 1 [Mycolicibacterium agri]PEG38577.1 allophanate hydrolase [Mycolicibacterium agri]GFG53560.1 allophanate hydrolase [Mycolicibacterium agri]